MTYRAGSQPKYLQSGLKRVWAVAREVGIGVDSCDWGLGKWSVQWLIRPGVCVLLGWWSPMAPWRDQRWAGSLWIPSWIPSTCTPVPISTRDQMPNNGGRYPDTLFGEIWTDKYMTIFGLENCSRWVRLYRIKCIYIFNL